MKIGVAINVKRMAVKAAPIALDEIYSTSRRNENS
jgi:uncharacterized pyridoxamine 5'-phosphate oxidase family protein